MRVPQAGDLYRVVKPFETMARVHYDEGDLLELIEPTDRSPFGHRITHGNWVVKCKHFSPPADETVWSMIGGLIKRGQIEYVCSVTIDL